jgi:hypothetical protein
MSGTTQLVGESILGPFERAVSGLLEQDLSAIGSGELTGLLQRMEVAARRFDTVKRATVAQIDRRGLAADYGVSKTSTLISQLLLISPSEAAARVTQAQDYCPRIALTGELLPPVFPAVAAALDTGQISLAHGHVITKLIAELPDHIEFEHGHDAQRFLVEQATLLNPKQLGHVATRLRDTLNPDGNKTREQDQQRRRDVSLTIHADGSSTPRGHLTPELTSTLRPVLDALSKPVPASDGMPDPRTPGQRRHDGLLDAVHRLLRSDTLPDSGGTPVSVILTITPPATPQASATVTDGYGTPLPLATALRLADEAEISSVVITYTGGILSFGKTRRIASPGQRKALTARDKGCSHPGCTVHAAWTQVHHIKKWRDGGDTDINNLVLLCGYHHRSFEAAGWTVEMTSDGIPQWIPPAWIDPQRKPRRNTAHDIPQMPLPESD